MGTPVAFFVLGEVGGLTRRPAVSGRTPMQVAGVPRVQVSGCRFSGRCQIAQNFDGAERVKKCRAFSLRSGNNALFRRADFPFVSGVFCFRSCFSALLFLLFFSVLLFRLSCGRSALIQFWKFRFFGGAVSFRYLFGRCLRRSGNNLKFLCLLVCPAVCGF